VYGRIDFTSNGEIAELVGAILGDGNIYGKRPSYVEVCGNPVADVNYFQNVLIPIVTSNLERTPKLTTRSRDTRFRINYKRFVDWLVEIGIPTGEGRGKIGIPTFITSNRELLRRCVRGVFDTDGTVYFDRRHAYRRPYPRVELHMTNFKLLKQVELFLNETGINCTLLRKGSIETAGVESLNRFLRCVGFANERHTNRIKAVYPELLTLDSV
jgi:intein/homing endonuclease